MGIKEDKKNAKRWHFSIVIFARFFAYSPLFLFVFSLINSTLLFSCKKGEEKTVRTQPGFEPKEVSIPKELKNPGTVNKEELRKELEGKSESEKADIVIRSIVGLPDEGKEKVDKLGDVSSRIITGRLLTARIITARSPRISVKSLAPLLKGNFLKSTAAVSLLSPIIRKKEVRVYKPFSKPNITPFSVEVKQEDGGRCPEKIVSETKIEFDYTPCKREKGKIVISGPKELITRFNQIDDGFLPDNLQNFKGTLTIKSENYQTVEYDYETETEKVYDGNIDLTIQFDIARLAFETEDEERKAIRGNAKVDISASANVQGKIDTLYEGEVISSLNIAKLVLGGAVLYTQKEEQKGDKDTPSQGSVEVIVRDTGIELDLNIKSKGEIEGEEADTDVSVKGKVSIRGESSGSRRVSELSSTERKVIESASIKEAQLSIDSLKSVITTKFPNQTTKVSVSLSARIKVVDTGYTDENEEAKYIPETEGEEPRWEIRKSNDSFSEHLSIGHFDLKISVEEDGTKTDYSLVFSTEQGIRIKSQWEDIGEGTKSKDKIDVVLRNLDLDVSIDNSSAKFASPEINLRYEFDGESWWGMYHKNREEQKSVFSVRKSYLRGFDGDEFFVGGELIQNSTYSEETTGEEGEVKLISEYADMSGGITLSGGSRIEFVPDKVELPDGSYQLRLKVLVDGEEITYFEGISYKPQYYEGEYVVYRLPPDNYPYSGISPFITVLPNGDYILNGLNMLVEDSGYPYRIGYIIHLNSDLSVKYARRFEKIAPTQGVVPVDDGYMVGYSFFSMRPFGTDYPIFLTGYIAKYNFSGEKVWGKKVCEGFWFSLSPAENGTIFSCGRIKYLSYFSNSLTWVVHFAEIDKNGNIVWQKAIQMKDKEVFLPFALLKSKDGEVFSAGGYISLTEEDSLSPYDIIYGRSKFSVIKLNQTSVLWFKALGLDSPKVSEIFAKPQEDMNIAETTDAVFLSTSNNLLVKIDKSNGDVMWAKKFGYYYSNILSIIPDEEDGATVLNSTNEIFKVDKDGNAKKYKGVNINLSDFIRTGSGYILTGSKEGKFYMLKTDENLSSCVQSWEGEISPEDLSITSQDITGFTETSESIVVEVGDVPFSEIQVQEERWCPVQK